jgi:hypothetical protein
MVYSSLPQSFIGKGVGMARTLLVLVVLAVLYGCGQTSSPVEKQEKEEGVEQAAEEQTAEETEKRKAGGEETTTETYGNIPISGVVGQNIETPSFDYRILDILITDHYYYLEGPSYGGEEDAFSEAGKFVVLTYSVTNTSPESVTANLGGMLHARTGNKVEVYEESDQAMHPYSGGVIGGLELAPREVRMGQFIFDVPTDVDPELLVVLYEDEAEEPRGEAGNVDLREEDPQGPKPEEILALQYEYSNMRAYEQAYELHAQESKDRVSRELYVSTLEQSDRKEPYAITDYSFPSVQVNGDRATIERVYTWETPDDEGQAKATQEMVLEEAGWRVVMRDNQYEFYLGDEAG